MPQRHLLILMTDQQRTDCLSSAGHPIVRTPNMDRLVKEGMRFATTYTPCPVCMPARNSFLTGQYCHDHGQWHNYGQVNPRSPNYARTLRAHGYHTAYIGKSHLYPHSRGHLNAGLPFMHELGWTDVFENTGPHATVHTESIMTDRWRKLGCLETFREDYRRRAKVGAANATWPSPMPPGETLDDFVGRTAVEYFESYHGAQPLLAFVGFGGPHEPWDAPADWAAQYDPARMDAMKPVTEPPSWLSPAAAAHHRKLQTMFPEMTAENNARIRALYYAKISHIDSWIGRILDVFRQRGWDANTDIVFWSDHGEMLGDKGRLYKEVFYEESVRVPLVLRTADRQGAGQVCHRLVNLIDVYPTLLDLAGNTAPWRGYGRSLMPLLGNPTAPHHPVVISEIDHRTMIRDSRFKLVVNDRDEALKLYDLESDPAESLNLAGQLGTESVVASLRDELRRLLLATPPRQQL